VAIGKNLGGGFQPKFGRCLIELAPQGSEKNQLWIEGKDRVGNHVGQGAISRSHVVKSAMRFDMIHPAAGGAGEGTKASDLVGNERIEIAKRHCHFGATEIFAVRKTGMRA